ncbi:hypothetical protein L208DRAFT_1449801 [Tricholoma matsutake]|nr:hypothetical protein L208DRAFT_1449801 [Tricholoma matsutake 945]
MFQSSRPIIIVTGANGGVGFGICQRLLFQLCHTRPSDAQPQSFARKDVDVDPGFLATRECDGLTIILACRNVKRAEAARTKLLQLLDTYIAKLKKLPGYDGHAEAFQKNVVLDTRELDLAVIGSLFKFANGVSQAYPYVSHLICNAGVVSIKSLDWIGCFVQVFTDFIGAITTPNYLKQHVGELSVDGLGWAWQCNVFGHYALYRALEPLLSSPSFIHPARVIWMSSLEASAALYSGIEDWQNKNTEYSYQSSKYQMDILATHLDSLSLAQAQKSSSQTSVVRHVITHPGICSTNVSKDATGPFMDAVKLVFFYIARLLGSENHTIDPFKAAVGAVHLSLAPLALLVFWPALGTSTDPQYVQSSTPVKYGAVADRWGTAKVRLDEVKEWEKNKGDAADLFVKCEKLYQTFKEAEDVTMDTGAGTEDM